VTPPLFLVDDLGSAGPSDTVVLTGAEAHHAANVKRLTTGELVLLSDGRGGIAHAEVSAVDRLRVVFTVLSRGQVAEPDPRFVVVQALPKGERAELAVEVLTELGADEIVPWAASRCVSHWKGEKVDKGVAKWRRTAVEASKQSRRARIPVIGSLSSTAAVLRRIIDAEAALVLHEEASEPLTDVTLPPSGDVLLIVGPEGGVSPEEVKTFAEAGASPVRLGAEVMRTSTAGAAALAVLSAKSGRWR
jgi:16S rRNA (uracil1498-N3)-methyltransferase